MADPNKPDWAALILTAALCLLVDGLAILVVLGVLHQTAAWVPDPGYWDSVAVAAGLGMLRSCRIGGGKA